MYKIHFSTEFLSFLSDFVIIFAQWNLVVFQCCLFDKNYVSANDIPHVINTQKGIFSPQLGQMCCSVLFLVCIL